MTVLLGKSKSSKASLIPRQKTERADRKLREHLCLQDSRLIPVHFFPLDGLDVVKSKPSGASSGATDVAVPASMAVEELTVAQGGGGLVAVPAQRAHSLFLHHLFLMLC